MQTWYLQNACSWSNNHMSWQFLLNHISIQEIHSTMILEITLVFWLHILSGITFFPSSAFETQRFWSWWMQNHEEWPYSLNMCSVTKLRVGRCITILDSPANKGEWKKPVGKWMLTSKMLVSFVPGRRNKIYEFKILVEFLNTKLNNKLKKLKILTHSQET